MKESFIVNRTATETIVGATSEKLAEENAKLRADYHKLKLKLEDSNEKIDRWLSMAEKNGGYLRFFRLYTKVLNKHEALFLQDMMNRSQMIRERVEQKKVLHPNKRKFQMDGKGFFRCTSRFMTNPKFMTWTYDEQRRMFLKMESLGFITKEKRGQARERWIKINLQTIYAMFDEAAVILRKEYRDWINYEGAYKKPGKSP